MGIVRRRIPKSIEWHEATGDSNVFRCAATVAQRPSDDAGTASAGFVGGVARARDERARERPRRPIAARRIADIDRHGGPRGWGRRPAGRIAATTRNWPLLQCGHRAYSMCETRRRNAATDSITGGGGNGAPSAARAAASPACFLAAASRP